MKVKTALFHVGVEAMGSVQSWREKRGATAETSDGGIIFTNSEGRSVLVPYSNIRCAEVEQSADKLHTSTGAPQTPKKASK